MTLIVNGVNMLPFAAFGGLKWQRADVDGEDAGRSVTGDMYRDRRALKYRVDVTCKPLTTAQAHTVLTAIKPEWVTVTYTDPEEGGDVTRTMYSNNIPASFLMKRKNGDELWGGITFPLIEK